MKRILITFIIVTSFSSSYCQDYSSAKIKMDGVVSYHELKDTTSFKIIKRTPQILIKESNESFYIGILSNDFLVTNIYIKKKNGFQILHASGSLGSVYYTTKKGNWEAITDNYHWAFVDPSLRDDPLTDDEVERELNYFYQNNQWVGTTFAIGSTRESEFVVSKSLAPSIEDIIISHYFRNTKGERIYKYYPENINQFTNSLSLDKELMNGYLPTLKNIHFDK